jgi:hypothetical protein
MVTRRKRLEEAIEVAGCLFTMLLGAACGTLVVLWVVLW